MLLTIPGLLDAETLARVRAVLAEAPFVDGRLSAGGFARRVKNNQELDPRASRVAELNETVLGTLYRDSTFRRAALPLRLSGAFFARYRPGMGYGEHIDDPVMGEGARYRSDVSITVFLSAPEDYAGGELTVRTSFGDTAVKLPAGDAVIYPSSSLHHVAPVTAGERLVAVAWAQSMVRDPARRELLYELDTARQALMGAMPEAKVTAGVDHVYVNLVRMWAEV